MIRFTAGEVAGLCGGRLLCGDPQTVFSGVAIDSREASAGQLFFALKGERVDGNDYVRAAFLNGASGAVVSRAPEGGLAGDRAVILVDDTRRALGMLAAEHRRLFRMKVVAVTGSVGKTSAKEMTASVLSVRYGVLKNEGNMNTEIGVPLTVFNAGEEHDVAVLELAMRLRGEIAWLAGIVGPSVGVITNISETHLERLGTQENIARAKAELLEALPEDGLAVLNGDNEWVRRVRWFARCPAVMYGMSPVMDVWSDGVKVGESGTEFTLHRGDESAQCFIGEPGEHQVYNAMAAACVGFRFGLTMDEVRDGLGRPRRAAMRSEIIDAGGVRVIDDAYNASPVSAKAALAVLSQIAGGRRIAVLGNMLELGEYAIAGHRETGAAAFERGVDVLVTVGDLAAEIAAGAVAAGMPRDRVLVCSTNAEAVAALRKMLRSGDTVLVKGSRGARMEEVVRGVTGGRS